MVSVQKTQKYTIKFLHDMRGVGFNHLRKLESVLQYIRPMKMIQVS